MDLPSAVSVAVLSQFVRYPRGLANYDEHHDDDVLYLRVLSLMCGNVDGHYIYSHVSG